MHSLQLKSPEGPPGHELESTAVLCTPDKTYNVRQVSTSNEVYLAYGSSNLNAIPLQPRLEAIAKFESTLEVHSANNASAAAYIKTALPVYTTTGHYESKSPLTKTELFANIPLSDVGCAQAYQDLACFEIEDGDGLHSLIPSSATKLQIWEMILTSATANAIDLTGGVDISEILSATTESGDWPRSMTKAIFVSMCMDAMGTTVQLHETKCARAVGETLLQVRTENGRQPTSLKSFTNAWADLLPEKWRGRADINLLERSYTTENEGKDVNFVEGGETDGAGAAAGAVTEAKSTLGAKRKWHEKFRASNKTA